MKISIIIPTKNHLEDCLRPCIDSIIKYTDLNNVDIIIVSNGSMDNTREYVDSLNNDKIKLIWKDEALGYAKSTNIGIKYALDNGSDYLILLNNDTILLEQPKNQWIEQLLEPFLVDDKIGISGPSMLLCEHSNSNFLIFFCVMISKKCFQKVGFLDEIFWSGGEDTDFCIKAVQNGFKIIQVPTSNQLQYDTSIQKMVGSFPIYHIGEKSVHEIKKWDKIFERNSNILYNRYGRK